MASVRRARWQLRQVNYEWDSFNLRRQAPTGLVAGSLTSAHAQPPDGSRDVPEPLDLKVIGRAEDHLYVVGYN